MRAHTAASAAGAPSFERLARRLGFEPARLAFTLRTAAGSGMALLLAGLLGLDHPQWAAMTVWIAAQPLRGHLIEKSLYRLLGTAAGALYGVALVALGHGSPAVLVPGLALWAGLCAGAGQLLRLVRCADAAGLAPGRAAREGLAVLATGQAVLALGQMLAQDAWPEADRRRAQAWLRRLARPVRSPAQAHRRGRLQAHRRGRLLARDALRLGPAPAGPQVASALQHAARALAQAG